MDAPCTALIPTPPTPATMTVSPGRTSAAFIAEPKPVPTPQPSRQTVSSGTSLGTRTKDASGTTLHGENVEISRNWLIGWPSACIR